MFELIDQTEHFIVVNKSAGIGFHNDEQQAGLFTTVSQFAKDQLAIKELYPVHRLDKMTSGLILFATSLKAANQFQQLFSQHQVEKYYLALSDKKPKKKQGLIKGDMAKSRRGMWKLLRSQTKPAITQFFSYSLANQAMATEAKGQRLFILKPHSGKTHQIRVALTSIGAPISGDQLYYPNAVAADVGNQERGYLHAYALRFKLFDQDYQYLLPPSQGTLFNDSGLTSLLKELAEPWLLNWPKI